ncbi:MAG: hypothetical protein ABI577_05425 [bacterium]
MAIENRKLVAGAKLVATYKKAEYFCEVLKTDEGLAFQMPDGKVFKSPSSAGKAVTGRVSCDGWKFWSLADRSVVVPATESASSEDATTAEPVEAKAAKVAAPKIVRVIKKMPNQKGVAEGSTKFWCSSCMKSFVAEGEAVPETCPDGHAKETADEFAVTVGVDFDGN